MPGRVENYFQDDLKSELCKFWFLRVAANRVNGGVKTCHCGDDLGLTLQTGFVTRALLGLFGSDRLRLAVSPDGSTFFDGLSIDNATGIVDQPQLPRFKAWTNFDNYVGVGTWALLHKSCEGFISRIQRGSWVA